MRATAPLLLALVLPAACGPGQATDPVALESADAKANYSVGYQIGGDFKRQGVPFDSNALVAGIRDAIEGGEARLSEEERRTTLTELKRRIVATEQAGREALAEKNLAAAKAFLDAHRSKEGGTTLPSGLP